MRLKRPNLRTRIGPLAIAIAMLTLMAAASGCGTNETADPDSSPETIPSLSAEPPTAREILDASNAAMEAVETVSVVWDTTLTLTEPQVYETKLVISGDFQAPDRSRFTRTATSNGISQQHDSIIIGEDIYHENPISGEWVAAPNTGIGAGEGMHLGQLAPKLRDEVASLFTLVGVEEISGVQVYYLQAQIPPDAIEDALGNASLFENTDDSPVDMEWWIGVEDSLVRRVRISYPIRDARSNLTASALTVLTFSDYGKAVDIQPPEVVAPSPPTTMPTPDPTPTRRP